MSLYEDLIASGVDGALIQSVTSVQLSEIERCRHRIASAAQFLSSAFRDGLSLHAQMRCVFESTYLCCCELADTAEFLSVPLEHPSMVIVNAAATLLDLTSAGNVTLRTLTDWASGNSPFVPLVKPEDACALSRDVVAQTIQYFANGPHDNVKRYEV
ncbi:hypothetical protein [Burkholderia diffusa]|uniref:hypothetical protein n=1 Tax=Burkholderia diffusa TaxID=488732 RepID=UPI002ABD406A|nr:hypothetical protein [Burkholderia diffusa]